MDHALAQELTKLSLSIQEGRRELDGLKAEKDAFLCERELEATQRVVEALERAKAAVKETEDYVHLIGCLQKEAKSVVGQIQEARIKLQADRRSLKDATSEARQDLETKGKELEAKMAQMQIEKLQLSGLIESVRVEKAQLKEEQRKTDDKRKMLGVAIKELKKKGLWQKQLGTEIE